MITILKLEVVPGKNFRSNWRSPMQKITTDKGVFLDNIPKAVHNTVNETGRSWEVGKTYLSGDYETFRSGGLHWLNKAKA